MSNRESSCLANIVSIDHNPFGRAEIISVWHTLLQFSTTTTLFYTYPLTSSQIKYKMETPHGTFSPLKLMV